MQWRWFYIRLNEFSCPLAACVFHFYNSTNAFMENYLEIIVQEKGLAIMVKKALAFIRRKSLLGWLPEVFNIGQKHIRAQVRMLGLAMLVGVVAGLGAIVFYVGTKYTEHYALGEIVGYYPQPHPAGETPLPEPPPGEDHFHPWLLLLIPTIGGLISGVMVFTLAPEAEGHGTDAVIAAYHSPGGQIRPRVPLVKIVASAITIGTRRIGRPRRPDRANRSGLRLLVGQSVAIARRRSPHPDGRRHGSGHRRHLSRAVGRGALRRRSALPFARVRAGSHHARGNRQRGFLLRLRILFRLAAAVQHPQPHLQQSLATWALYCC